MNKKRILIIDDEASFTRLLVLNLGCTGKYTLRAENWAPHGLAAVQEFQPDLILLDVMMPGMDGGRIAAELQANPSLKKIPLVFLTAAVKKEEVQSRNGLIGGFAYLAKPVTLNEVTECLEKSLGKQPGAEEAVRQNHRRPLLVSRSIRQPEVNGRQHF